MPIGSLIRILLGGFSDTDIPVWVTEIWYAQGNAAKYKGPRPGAAKGGR